MVNLCLNMIVKNEAHIIERCLMAARPHIQRWCIVDTGSTDGTQARIRELLADIPGELHERPWKNFAHNRNEALELAKQGGGYALFLDADDVLSTDPGAGRPVADSAFLTIHTGEAMRFQRVGIVDLTKPWRWAGAVHEYLSCETGATLEILHGWHVRSISDSARNQGGNKFLRDIEMLEAELREHPEDTRTVFYLAQSYRDAGMPAKALPLYQQRAEMGGFDEEAFYAQYMVGVMYDRLGDWRAAAIEYGRAYERRPTRAEPLHALAYLHRMKGMFCLAALYAERATKLKIPSDILFNDDAVYTWKALDELAVALYWCGRFDEAVEANKLLLEVAPVVHHPRTRANLEFSMQKAAER